MDINKETNNTQNEIKRRIEYIASSIKNELKSVPIDLEKDGKVITLSINGILICRVFVEEDTYKVNLTSAEWANETTYYCEEGEDHSYSYYVETVEEVIGEVVRLIVFEGKKKKTNAEFVSDKYVVRSIITEEAFQKAYSGFMLQAEKNAVSRKSEGSRIPLGFEYTNGKICGKNFTQHYGQGAASKTPYINWHVVSIYYIVESSSIILGIEATRYPYLNKMKPLRKSQIGNKKVDVAIFYETTKDKLEWEKLYREFIRVIEEVMALGLG